MCMFVICMFCTAEKRKNPTAGVAYTKKSFTSLHHITPITTTTSNTTNSTTSTTTTTTATLYSTKINQTRRAPLTTTNNNKNNNIRSTIYNNIYNNINNNNDNDENNAFNVKKPNNRLITTTNSGSKLKEFQGNTTPTTTTITFKSSLPVATVIPMQRTPNYKY